VQAGFLGGWIVIQLLQRGESPKNIRVLDIRLPTRKDLTTGAAKDVKFMQVDITDAAAVLEAFRAPWAGSPEAEVTVFHTAANIRFFERHPGIESRSTKVNVVGTQNVLEASRAIGVTAMIYTSSGSVSVHSSRFLLWPWQKEPDYFVQYIDDDDNRIPKHHADFFSNYASSKAKAEGLVRAANATPSGSHGKVLRTGCIRPGNGVFGPGGDVLCGAYLARKVNPTWISNIVSHFVYVENCALSHLLYEARLIEGSTATRPDISGQAYAITDPGTPPTYGDVYNTLTTLTNGETYFPELSPTSMLLVSYLIEFYYLTRYFVFGDRFLPAVNSDLVNLQPSLYNLTMVHLIFDDSRARKSPEEGGLGYRGAWTTLQGLHKTEEEHRKGFIPSLQRSESAGIGFGLAKAQRGVGKVAEAVERDVGVDILKR